MIAPIPGSQVSYVEQGFSSIYSALQDKFPNNMLTPWEERPPSGADSRSDGGEVPTFHGMRRFVTGFRTAHGWSMF
jgi:hypothetical protein